MSEEIILIGPMAAGKSAIGECLADILGHEQHPLDVVQRKYFKENGYDDAYADKLRQADIHQFRLYREPFYVNAIEQELSRYKGKFVFDFGASQSVYSNNANLDRVKTILAPYSQVILLLPSDDIQHSREELLQRKIKQYSEIGQTLDEQWFLETNDYYLTNQSNFSLAKHIVYTDGRTRQEICADILKLT